MKDMSKIGKSNVRRGKTLERRVAKLLSEWTGSDFRRRRVEGRDSITIERDSTADVISVSRPSILSIEVKNASGFSIDALLANPSSNKLTIWWHQAAYDASLMTDLLGVKIFPFLFFKPIRSWDWVMFPTSLIDDKIFRPVDDKSYSSIWFAALRYDHYGNIPPVEANVSQSKNNPVMVPLNLPPAYLCRWDCFQKNVDPNCIFYSMEA